DDADQAAGDGAGDQEVVLPVEVEEELPGQDADEAQGGEEEPEREAGHELAPDDAPPVAQLELAEREGAYYQCGGLRAGVAAAADDEGNEEGEDDAGGSAPLREEAHGPRREHLAQEQPRQPPAALPQHLSEADAQVRRVEGFHAAQLLDVLGRLLLHDVDDVVDGDDALHPALGVDDRHGDEVLLAHILPLPPLVPSL